MNGGSDDSGTVIPHQPTVSTRPVARPRGSGLLLRIAGRRGLRIAAGVLRVLAGIELALPLQPLGSPFDLAFALTAAEVGRTLATEADLAAGLGILETA